MRNFSALFNASIILLICTLASWSKFGAFSAGLFSSRAGKIALLASGASEKLLPARRLGALGLLDFGEVAAFLKNGGGGQPQGFRFPAKNQHLVLALMLKFGPHDLQVQDTAIFFAGLPCHLGSAIFLGNHLKLVANLPGVLV